LLLNKWMVNTVLNYTDCQHDDAELMVEMVDIIEDNDLLYTQHYSCVHCGAKGVKKYIIPCNIEWNERSENNE